MAANLPIDRPWYRQLSVASGVLGLVVGLLGLAYLGATGEVTDLVFGDPASTPGPGTGGGSPSPQPAS